ncbi:hypothetical protein GF406_03080 [candidate division KSB1 bacterium]|nr:hypothetical protein [candidate division KSB1 bacterium]
MNSIKAMLFFLLPICLNGQILTVQQCIDRALANNSELAADVTQYEKRLSQVKEASSQLLPQADLSLSYQRQSTVPELEFPQGTLPGGMPLSGLFPKGGFELGSPDQIDARLKISQPLFTGFRLRRQKEARKEHVNVSKQNMEQNKRDLIFRVYKTYGQVLQARNLVDIAETSRNQIQSHLQDVQHLLQQGMARKDQVLRVKVKLSEAELTILKAQNGLKLSKAALEQTIGESLDHSLHFTEWQLAIDVDSLAVAIDRALKNRSEIQALNRMHAATRIQTQIAKGGRWPSVSAFGILGYGKPGLDFIENEWMDYWIVGIGSQWKVWDWGKTNAQIEYAQLESRRLEYQLEAVRDAIRLDVEQAWFNWQETAERIQLTLEIEEQARLSFEIVNNSFNQGMATQSEVLDAQSELTRARTLVVQTRIEHSVAAANLARAMEMNIETHKK